MKSKPDLILITGAPGSGKSTLARLLGEKLYSYTHIDPDDMLQSFWECSQEDPAYDREKIGIPKFKSLLELLAKNNVRLVVDMQADENFMRTIMENSSLLNIHCVAYDTAQRFYDRETLDGTVPDWLEDHMPEIKRLETQAQKPIDIGQEILLVDCNNGYNPTIDEIIKEIEK